jgi:hypothetical protein
MHAGINGYINLLQAGSEKASERKSASARAGVRERVWACSRLTGW